MFWRIKMSGRILAVKRQEVKSSAEVQLIHSLLRGEPYQLAGGVVEYTIRVKKHHGSGTDRIYEFRMFGTRDGDLREGDEVQIRARKSRNRMVVRSIRNRTTGVVLRPGFQIPAAVFRIPIAAISILLTLVVWWLIWLLAGGLTAVVLTLIATVIIPTAVMIKMFLRILKMLPKYFY